MSIEWPGHKQKFTILRLGGLWRASRPARLARTHSNCSIRLGLVFHLLRAFIGLLSRLMHSLLGALLGGASGLLGGSLRIRASALDVLFSGRVTRLFVRVPHGFLGFLLRSAARFLRRCLRIRPGILGILFRRGVLPGLRYANR